MTSTLSRLPQLSRFFGQPRARGRSQRVGATAVMTVWTDDPVRAAAADAAGVDRIGVDLRTACLPAVRSVVHRAALAVRLSMQQAGSAQEIERLLGEEFRVLFLPTDAPAELVRAVAGVVRGRAVLVATVGSIGAALRVDDVLSVPGIAEVHLSLEGIGESLGLTERFESLTEPIVAEVAARVHRAGKRLGLGGIGRAGDKSLPLSSDLLYAQHARLRASSVVLAHSFFPPDAFGFDLEAEVTAARQRLAEWQGRSAREIELAHTFLAGRSVPARRWTRTA